MTKATFSRALAERAKWNMRLARARGEVAGRIARMTDEALLREMRTLAPDARVERFVHRGERCVGVEMTFRGQRLELSHVEPYDVGDILAACYVDLATWDVRKEAERHGV